MPKLLQYQKGATGEYYKRDSVHWLQTSYPDYFPRPILLNSIRAGSFFCGPTPPTDTIKPNVVYPDYFPKSALSRAIQSGSFSVGEIWKPVVVSDIDVHYPIFPNYFPRQSLSKAIQAGSFSFPIPPTDPNVPRILYPDYFLRPSLSRAIQSSIFSIGEIWKPIVVTDTMVHYSVFPDCFIKPILARSLQAAAFTGPIHPSDLIKPSIIYPDSFIKSFLSRAIQSGTLSGGEIWKPTILPDVMIHYAGFPDRFIKSDLSRAIISGSFFVGEGAPKKDKDLHYPIFPEYFKRPHSMRQTFTLLVWPALAPIVTFAETLIARPRDFTLRVMERTLSLAAANRILAIGTSSRDFVMRVLKAFGGLTGKKRD